MPYSSNTSWKVTRSTGYYIHCPRSKVGNKCEWHFWWQCRIWSPAGPLCSLHTDSMPREHFNYSTLLTKFPRDGTTPAKQYDLLLEQSKVEEENKNSVYGNSNLYAVLSCSVCRAKSRRNFSKIARVGALLWWFPEWEWEWEWDWEQMPSVSCSFC